MRSTGCVVSDTTRPPVLRPIPAGNAKYWPSDVNVSTGVNSSLVKSIQCSILLDTPVPEIPWLVAIKKGLSSKTRAPVFRAEILYKRREYAVKPPCIDACAPESEKDLEA